MACVMAQACTSQIEPINDRLPPGIVSKIPGAERIWPLMHPGRQSLVYIAIRSFVRPKSCHHWIRRRRESESRWGGAGWERKAGRGAETTIGTTLGLRSPPGTGQRIPRASELGGTLSRSRQRAQVHGISQKVRSVGLFSATSRESLGYGNYWLRALACSTRPPSNSLPPASDGERLTGSSSRSDEQ
jgi:hypothetical protein